jgi:predicted aspartyl protease
MTRVLSGICRRQDVEAAIRTSLAVGISAPLLGQSFLNRFSSWSIDNERQMLLSREKDTTQ